jgi:hypothetical protein
VALPLQPSYTRYTLSPILTTLQLFSSLVAFVGLINAGYYLLRAAEVALIKAMGEGSIAMLGLVHLIEDGLHIQHG